jgi:hypothetical protein
MISLPFSTTHPLRAQKIATLVSDFREVVMAGFGKPIIAGTSISTARIASRFNARNPLAISPRNRIARPNKSKKRFVGNAGSLSLPEEFVLYLEENLRNSRHILESLDKLRIRFEQHLKHFPGGTLDEV